MRIRTEATGLVHCESMRRGSVLALVFLSSCGEGDASVEPTTTDDSAVSDGATVLDADPGDGIIFPTEDTGAPVVDAMIPADYPLPPVPTTCPRTARVVMYDPNGSESLVDALEANVAPCATYFVHVPAVIADKTMPRGPLEPATIRARKGRFFALAEFHYGAWAERTDMSWFDKGVEFRKRMDAAGYNLARGDTWVVNDLPSTVRTDVAVRTNVKDLMRGLYTGVSGSAGRAGVVFVINQGHESTSLTTYKTNHRSWLTDASFWTEMDKYVQQWGQEAYTSATRVCVAAATVAGRAERVNDFVMHPGRHAYSSLSPATSVASARIFFDGSYFPLMTAAWKSAGGFGDTSVSLDVMKHHVSLQVYAARLWLETHTYPDGRLGFVWDESAGTAAERTELATRLAQSIRDAYAVGATAARACSPTGAFTWCDCSVTGAAFNDTWKTFSTW